MLNMLMALLVAPTVGLEALVAPTLRSLSSPHLRPSELRRAPAWPLRGPPPRFHTTKQDHFDQRNKRTWQQAYYVNDTFFDGSGPVFLCVGGEGPPLDGSAVVSSVHCNIAAEALPKFKALMFAVEHRYYGCHNESACPYDASDKQPLRWLSSRQAIEDLRTFHEHASDAYGLSPSKNKWVSFGGSYPGMLAGWFRVMHPQLVHASMSSSAPVHAKLEMSEYFDITARAYSLASVGGSAACEGHIREGHAMIGTLMNTTAGRARLATLFDSVRRRGPKWLTTRQGQQEFAGNGVVAFPSQGNDPQCTTPACNIEKICEVMAAAGNASGLERLATLAKLAARRNAAADAVELAPPPVEALKARAAAVDSPPLHQQLDYWGWQTCNEFGFYQTCEIGSRCFFTQGLNRLADDDGFCVVDYGISPSQIMANIDATNAHYGAGRPDLVHNATRILYVNGDVDPWSGLSILTAPSAALPTLLVPGASHHAWTHPSTPLDQPSVVAARETIRSQVFEWLAEP